MFEQFDLTGPLPTKLEELESLYLEMDAFGGTINKRLGQLENQMKQEMKRHLAAVGADRDGFVRRKGEVFRALQAAKANEAAETLVEEVLNEPPAQQPQPVAPPAGDAPSLQPPAVDPPTVPEAGALTQPAGAGQAGDAPPAPPTPPVDEVKPGLYASVSNDTIANLLKENEEAIRALPDVKAPESRVDAIALLVRAGIRPPKKAK